MSGWSTPGRPHLVVVVAAGEVCKKNQHTGHTRTDREQHPRHIPTHRHTHDKNNATNPQTNTSHNPHKHLTTLEGGARRRCVPRPPAPGWVADVCKNMRQLSSTRAYARTQDTGPRRHAGAPTCRRHHISRDPGSAEQALRTDKHRGSPLVCVWRRRG